MKRSLVLCLALLSVPAWADLSSSPKVAATQAALRDLWVGHIFWVRNASMATMTNNKEAATAAEAEVVANAKAIAGAIEPFYGKEASDKLFNLLAAHGGHHVAQNQQLKAKKYADEARTWDAMKGHMYVIADALGEGIAKQFPEKFKPGA